MQSPHILGVFAAQDVTLAAGQVDAKIRGAGRIPTVFYLGDVDHLLADLQSHRALVALVPGVTFHAHGALTQWLSHLYGCRPAPRSTPRPGK